MNKLIKLEFKKHKLLGYAKGVFITNIVIMAFMCFIYIVEKIEGGGEEALFGSYDVVFNFILTLTTATFLIFGSVVLARLVIEEYKNKTITLLFTYPLSRKKLLSAKLIVVSSFIFSAILFSNIFIGGVVYLVDVFANIIPSDLSVELLTHSFLLLIVNIVTAAGIGLIPLYFGMRKKSVPATIVSAIILVSFLNSFTSNVLSWSYVTIMFALAVIGVCIAYLSFRNIEQEDVVL